jgi:hypothetical protein
LRSWSYFEKLESLVSRVFLFGAFLLLVVALFEKAANLYGQTILSMSKAATYMETAVVLLVFVELTRSRRQPRYAATVAAACCFSKSIGLT